jgi:RNA polymerase sigma-70 factor (ECF subfamily)
MSAADPSPAGAPAGAAPGAVPERSREWIEDHLDAVYRYARRRLPAPDAEDVAQQAFVALFQADVAGRAPEDPGAYLLGTARRRIADLHRRRALRREPVALPHGWDRYADDVLPDEALAIGEMRDLVHVALGFLPGEQRRILLDRAREGTPVAELARREGITEKAVEMRLRRARAAFRERLLEVGGDWAAASGGTA